MSVYQMTKLLQHPQIVMLKTSAVLLAQSQKIHISWCKLFPTIPDNVCTYSFIAGLSHNNTLHVDSSLLRHATNKFYLTTTEFDITAV